MINGCSRPSTDAIVLIVVDTLRPDRLASYGYDMYDTPQIDSLAAAGTRFTQARSVSSWALPSMGAMMTSRYPSQLGLVERPGEPDERFARSQIRQLRSGTLSADETTLAEMMQAAGYRTAAFVNQPVLNAADGFVQGFDDYHFGTGGDAVGRYDPASPLAGREWPEVDEARILDERLIESLDGWLTANSKDPVFVWVHLLTPHKPHTPPPWTRRRTSSTKERFAKTGPTDLYDGEVLVADDLVGRVVRAFDRHFGADRTAVILVSDNGEAFGERGELGHGHTIHSEVTHVPLIVRAPTAPAGRTVKTIVSTLDILPTVLELGGVELPGAADIFGESLVPLFARDGAHRSSYAEGVLTGDSERALMAGGKRLFLDVGANTYTLYDLLFDPDETVNLMATLPALADSLRRQLDAMHQDMTSDSVPEDAESAARVLEALRILGHTR